MGGANQNPEEVDECAGGRRKEERGDRGRRKNKHSTPQSVFYLFVGTISIKGSRPWRLSRALLFHPRVVSVCYFLVSAPSNPVKASVDGSFCFFAIRPPGTASAVPSVLFSPLSICNLRPPSRELDSVPLRLDPTCHQDASLRIRPIQCVRLGAVWFCFPLLGFLRYAPRSPSAHPRTCCFSKCPRVAATNINGGLKLGEGRPHFLLLFRLYSPILFTVRRARHLQPLPVGSLTVTFNQLTRWLFFFAFCRLWFFHKFLQIASLISHSS